LGLASKILDVFMDISSDETDHSYKKKLNEQLFSENIITRLICLMELIDSYAFKSDIFLDEDPTIYMNLINIFN
jgi:hypothetical protein